MTSNNIGVVHSRGEDNGLVVNNLLGVEAASFPYATLTLAVLALLGLVSVARRNDIG